MKIAFITEHFNPGLGGAETYMSDFAKYLISKGHEVHFYTQDDLGEYEGIKFHIIKVTGLAKKVRWMQWLSFLKQARKESEKEAFDVVMGTGKCLGVNVFQPHGGTVRASHRQNAILVRNPLHIFLKKLSNSISPKHMVAKWIEKQQYSNPKTVFVAISQMVRNHMKEFYNVPEGKIELVYNGIDTSKFSPATDEERNEAKKQLGLPIDKVVYSVVAHNFKLKGIKEIIESAVLVKKAKENFLIVVAGYGKQKNFIKQAEAAGVAENIKFLGAVNNPELVYKASDVYVQPTWYDPCSLVVLEALASGIPVITSKFNGAGEFIDNGKEGYIISRPDAKEELSTAMINLFDKDLREEQGKAARKKIEDQTLLRNFEQMLSVFEKASSLK